MLHKKGKIVKIITYYLHLSDNTRADLTARGFGNMGQDLLMDFCCGHPGAKSYPSEHCR
jgi:hypothetical protein